MNIANISFHCRGFDQDEITCNPNLRDERGVWNVELVVDPRRKESIIPLARQRFL